MLCIIKALSDFLFIGLALTDLASRAFGQRGGAYAAFIETQSRADMGKEIIDESKIGTAPMVICNLGSVWMRVVGVLARGIPSIKEVL